MYNNYFVLHDAYRLTYMNSNLFAFVITSRINLYTINNNTLPPIK